MSPISLSSNSAILRPATSQILHVNGATLTSLRRLSTQVPHPASLTPARSHESPFRELTRPRTSPRTSPQIRPQTYHTLPNPRLRRRPLTAELLRLYKQPLQNDELHRRNYQHECPEPQDELQDEPQDEPPRDRYWLDIFKQVGYSVATCKLIEYLVYAGYPKDESSECSPDDEEGIAGSVPSAFEAQGGNEQGTEEGMFGDYLVSGV